jgi:O-antigen ligase
MDWVVLARLLACTVGFIAGTILIAKNMPLGFGAKMLLLYAVAAGFSAVTSQYPATVVGYFILLLGACVLMTGLAYSARHLAELETIERVWFFTVVALIVKDTVTSLIRPEMAPAGEVIRIGMGVTHANEISSLATLVFWLSFSKKKTKHTILLWLLRAFLVYVIIGARSRVSIVAFLLGGLLYVLFASKDYLKRWVVVSAGVGALSTFFLLSFGFDQAWAKDIVSYARRGQEKAALTTLTGRTLIWQHVVSKSYDSPIAGHGYGVSRLTMGTIPQARFQPYHCHNELLEVFFTTGLLGLVPFLLIVGYSLKWLKAFSRLRRVLSASFALHAVCSIAIVLAGSMFEARLAGKLSPVQPLFFFYLLTLDREKHFQRLRQI